MKKKIFRYAAAFAVLVTVTAGISYLYAFSVLKKEVEKHGEVSGFKLFADGVVLDRYKIGPAVTLTRVYLHGLPWQLLQDKAEYVSVAKAEIDADTVLNQKISWPFTSQNIDIAQVTIGKTVLEKKLAFTGSAKQTPDTPLLLEFSNEDEEQALSGKAEIRLENNQARMIDIDFDEADLELALLKTKRGTGWLSFSWEDGWQVVGEMDSGITLLGPYQFFDSTLKITGPVTKMETSFAGKIEQQVIAVEQREGNYFVRQEDATYPIAASNKPLEEIIAALDKAAQDRLARQQKEQAKVQTTVQKKPDKDNVTKQEKEKKSVTLQMLASQQEQNNKQDQPPLPVIPEPVVSAVPLAPILEPIKLPEISIKDVTAQTLLAGFMYEPAMVQITQPCADKADGCWTAHGQGGKFSYNPYRLPPYFLRLKNYEQVQQLRDALLDFNVQTIKVTGKDQIAAKILLQGTTAKNQPAEIELSVEGAQ